MALQAPSEVSSAVVMIRIYPVRLTADPLLLGLRRPSAWPTTPGAPRSSFHTRTLLGGRTRIPEADPAGTPVEGRHPESCARTDSLCCTPAPSSAEWGRSGCAAGP